MKVLFGDQAPFEHQGPTLKQFEASLVGLLRVLVGPRLVVGDCLGDCSMLKATNCAKRSTCALLGQQPLLIRRPTNLNYPQRLELFGSPGRTREPQAAPPLRPRDLLQLPQEQKRRQRPRDGPDSRSNGELLGLKVYSPKHGAKGDMTGSHMFERTSIVAQTFAQSLAACPGVGAFMNACFRTQ